MYGVENTINTPSVARHLFSPTYQKLMSRVISQWDDIFYNGVVTTCMFGVCLGAVIIPFVCYDNLSNPRQEGHLTNFTIDCLGCHATTKLCQLTCCSCCCPNALDERTLVNSFVSSGDTCFIRCRALWGCCFEAPLDFTATDDEGNTALHYAVSELYYKTRKVPDGERPLFHIYPSLKKRTVNYLLANGADPAVINKNGKTAFAEALREYVSLKTYNKLKAAHESVLDKVQEFEREQQAAEEKRKKEESDAFNRDFPPFEKWFINTCKFSNERSASLAETLISKQNCRSVEELRQKLIGGDLKSLCQKIQTTAEEQQVITQSLMSSGAVEATPTIMTVTAVAKKPSQVVPINNIVVAESDAVAVTDCFLTHDWGTDELGRSNHDRVSRVNAYLKSKGLVTWFDEDRMEGNVRRKMTEGIENTLCMVVFVTDRYRNKVNGTDDRDNCRYEFTYGVEQLGPQKMVPVVMEEGMLNARGWKQELGAALATKLYTTLLSDDEEAFAANCADIYDRIRSVIGKSRIERGEVVAKSDAI